MMLPARLIRALAPNARIIVESEITGCEAVSTKERGYETDQQFAFTSSEKCVDSNALFRVMPELDGFSMQS